MADLCKAKSFSKNFYPLWFILLPNEITPNDQMKPRLLKIESLPPHPFFNLSHASFASSTPSFAASSYQCRA